jgi:hypothetical protein
MHLVSGPHPSPVLTFAQKADNGTVFFDAATCALSGGDPCASGQRWRNNSARPKNTVVANAVELWLRQSRISAELSLVRQV